MAKRWPLLFAIQQKYDFSSKSQRSCKWPKGGHCCLQYSKSTIFQANHNTNFDAVVKEMLFAIQQKYDFSSKSQLDFDWLSPDTCCLQYSKSTIFQANHNYVLNLSVVLRVVCNTAKVRFFKQITTLCRLHLT